MKPLKFKLTTKQKEVVSTQGYEGKAFRIQAVFYSSTDPSKHLYLYDKDNSIIAHPIPGQMEAKLMEMFPVSFYLPIRVLDEGDNELTIYGELI